MQESEKGREDPHDTERRGTKEEKGGEGGRRRGRISSAKETYVWEQRPLRSRIPQRRVSLWGEWGEAEGRAERPGTAHISAWGPQKRLKRKEPFPTFKLRRRKEKKDDMKREIKKKTE